MIANSPLNSIEIYTAYDRTPLPHIGDFPNYLHTDMKLQNQAIQCCLLDPRSAKYGKAVGRERAASVYTTLYMLLMRLAHILAQDID